ncbi:CSEP0157 putative effector protein [Blumeria hordei DH14]|uniref:CSEP0157 putative effector protein n=1 Tax=Blumeria graminis f. sp. hordei (strain DH14) TaxID=546991 RepID=N1J8S6_BLUG1|nr:CSEP0157 putative effector protein [Blumeria hordei DH14]
MYLNLSLVCMLLCAVPGLSHPTSQDETIISKRALGAKLHRLPFVVAASKQQYICGNARLDYHKVIHYALSQCPGLRMSVHTYESDLPLQRFVIGLHGRLGTYRVKVRRSLTHCSVGKVYRRKGSRDIDCDIAVK